MGRPYELIVFDWEGTLGDPLGYLLNMIDEQACLLGWGPIDRRRARQYLPQGLELTLKKLLPELSTQQTIQWFENIQSSLKNNTKEQCLFEGARRLVSAIQKAGMHLAIATNKGPQSLQKALQATNMSEFFRVTRSAGQVPAKPCPQMLEEIMDAFFLGPEKTLMIGDSVADVEMALATHVECIGIDFYGQQKEVLKSAGALTVFDDYPQIGHFLELVEYLKE
jgi:phosphoglycolate phosphatase